MDVDQELGLFRVVQIDTVQDVGFMINPRSVIGQIEGGTMQGSALPPWRNFICWRTE